YFESGSAIGRRIRLGDEQAPWLTIVGVVSSLVPDTGARDRVTETVYLPFSQSPDRGVMLLARTTGDPAAIGPAVRALAARDFQDTPVTNVNSLAGHLWRSG